MTRHDPGRPTKQQRRIAYKVLLWERDRLDAEIARLKAELERRIREYEGRYGIATDEVHAAIDDGRIDETHDVCNWIMDAELLRRTARLRP